MIAAELLGRLGNQMFIISTAYSLALDNNDKCVFPYKSSGIIPSDKQTQIYFKTIYKNLNFTDSFNFIENTHYEPEDQSYLKIDYKPNLLLKGYFQSEKHFSHNREKILELFKPIKEVENFINKKYDKIFTEDYVSVHIRRGDYLRLSDYHTVLNKEYYDKSMSLFKDKSFVFFSDDIEWCKNTFNNDKNIFIDNQDDVLDLYLMSKIKNNIIANSSFSWWAAWLNQNKDKQIIAPKNWFAHKNSHLNIKDLIPENWIVI